MTVSSGSILWGWDEWSANNYYLYSFDKYIGSLATYSKDLLQNLDCLLQTQYLLRFHLWATFQLFPFLLKIIFQFQQFRFAEVGMAVILWIFYKDFYIKILTFFFTHNLTLLRFFLGRWIFWSHVFRTIILVILTLLL